MTNKRHLLTVQVCILVFLTLSEAVAGYSGRSDIILTADPVSAVPKRIFSGYETIYALITLSGLQAGEYSVGINWVDPAGDVNQHTPLRFRVEAGQSTYTFTSWLRLMRNGPLKSGFTGRSFDDNYLGTWKLHIFVNDTLLEQRTFEIH